MGTPEANAREVGRRLMREVRRAMTVVGRDFDR
jgi:hypothetical protein